MKLLIKSTKFSAIEAACHNEITLMLFITRVFWTCCGKLSFAQTKFHYWCFRRMKTLLNCNDVSRLLYKFLWAACFLWTRQICGKCVSMTWSSFKWIYLESLFGRNWRYDETKEDFTGDATSSLRCSLIKMSTGFTHNVTNAKWH